MGWVKRTWFWFFFFWKVWINIYSSFAPLCLEIDLSNCYIPVWIEGACLCNVNLNSESPWNAWPISWLKESWATWTFYTWFLPHQIIIVPLRTYQSELNQFPRVTMKCMKTFIHLDIHTFQKIAVKWFLGHCSGIQWLPFDFWESEKSFSVFTPVPSFVKLEVVMFIS